MIYRNTLTPYLVNAFYTWCMDTHVTPLIVTHYDGKNILPPHLKNEDSIHLSIHPNAVRNLVFGKDTIEFEALFGGLSFQVILYYGGISRIYNLEDEYGIELLDKIPPKPRKNHHLVLIKNQDKTQNK